jgi:hypothetical protein
VRFDVPSLTAALPVLSSALSSPVADYMIAQAIPKKPDPITCDVVANSLHGRILDHLRTDSNHQELQTAIDEYLSTDRKNTATQGNWTARVTEIVLEYVLYNETMGLLSMQEVQNLQKAIPEYGIFRTSQQTQNEGPWDTLKSYVDPEAWWKRLMGGISFFIKAKQSVDQWIQHRAEAPAVYFKVTRD